jgi:large subunit ribosomal protein L7/L12
MPDLAKLVEDLSSLSLLDAAQLTKMLEEKWGVSASAPMAMGAMPMMAGGAAAGAAAAPTAVEQTEFDVVLKEAGPNKIQVIKVVRELTNNALGLREAKEAVETLPNTFKKGVTKEEAELARTKLTDVGAVVEIV